MKEKMKFDVVVGNPPYQIGAHLDFLEIAYGISKKYIIWINPASWLLDERGTNKKYEKIKNLLGEKIDWVKIFNANPLFHTKLKVPFSIIFINKEKQKEGIDFEDFLNNKNEVISSISQINRWSENKTYPELKKKILNLCQSGTLRIHINKKIGNFFVNISKVRGNNIYTNQNKLYKDDFFTFLNKNQGVDSKITGEGTRSEHFVSFKSKEEAENFVSFLKTKWARFCLSIYKIDHNVAGNFLDSTPWLDWSKPWTEERFEKLIDATPEEIEFVHKNIPDYYGIAKK